MTNRVWRWLGLTTVAVGASMLAVNEGCSVVVNTTAVQCLSEAECQSRGGDFKNTTCDAQTKTCVPIPILSGCTKSADCVSGDAGTGPFTICRKSDGRCIPLRSPECPTVFGTSAQVQSDNVVILGLFSPANQDVGGSMVEKAVGLAEDDLTKNAVGLPPQTAGMPTRPVVFVGCNEFGAGIDGLLRAGSHLIKDLQVPIIVGPFDSQNAIQIATQLSLPNKTLMVLPTSALSGLSLLPNPSAPTPLIWRMSRSDSSGASLVAKFVPGYVEQRVKDLGIVQNNEAVRVMIVAEGNVIGLAFADILQQKLTFNGKSTAANAMDGNFQLGNIGDQRDPVANPNPAATAASVVAQAITFKPHIILYTTGPVGITTVWQPIEAQWPMSTPKPVHVSLQSTWAISLLYGLMGADPSKQQRMYIGRGKPVVGFDTSEQAPWDSRFRVAYPEYAMVPPFAFSYAAFDAAYVAMLAAAGTGSAPLTGTNAANVLFKGRLNPPGTMTKAKPSELAGALNMLSTGGGVDFEGIGDGYAFEASTGAVPYDAEIVCIDVSAGPVPPAGATKGVKASGYYWDHNTDQGAGTVMNCP